MNNGKQRTVWLALLALLCLLLAGCGKQAAPVATQAPEAAQTPEPAPGVTLAPVPVETQAPASAGFGALAVETLSYDEAAARVRADGDAVVLFAANVGKADALALRVGDWIGLVDTGYTWARGRVVKGLTLLGADTGSPLDAVFLTHTDDDHAGGLRWLSAGAAKSWYAPAMYTGVKADKHPLTKAVGDAVQWLRRGDALPLGDTGATLRVLAPASQYEDKDDNNSLVMMLESDQGKILLTGDMELPEEAELLGQGDDLKCDVLKVPNHADDDTVSAEFANACAAAIAVVSTSSEEKPETPDPGVVRRLEAAGSRVVVTEDGPLGVLVTLKGGVATVNYVDFGAPELTGVTIIEVDASDDRIVLKNDSDSAVDLGGCTLFSDRGQEIFAFPDGASVAPGATLTVGTNSTEGSYDLLWDDKKVVNKKKEDNVCLYDAWGRLVDWKGNS